MPSLLLGKSDHCEVHFKDGRDVTTASHVEGSRAMVREERSCTVEVIDGMTRGHPYCHGHDTTLVLARPRY